MSDSHVGRPQQKSNGNRPKYSYFTMISMAIEHQEDQKATIQDIYKFIRDSFPYYRDFPDSKWHNAVRYTLSTNDCFVKVKRNDARKHLSSYWIIHKDSHSWLAKSNPMRRVRAFKIGDIVCRNHVITSQDKTTDNSCNNLDKTSEVKKIQLDNVPRAYEVADGSKVEVEGETRTPQGHFQFNNLLGTHGLDNTAFSISTLPTPKGLSHYTCQDSYSIPSSHHPTETPQGQFQYNTTLGPHELDNRACSYSQLLSTSHDIPYSIPFPQYLTESSQCQQQVMPGAYGLYDFSKNHAQQHEGETFKMQACHDPSYQFNCNNMTVENISKSIPFSTFDFQFPESQATNNPNMFQFQQKTPFMSTVPQDVVNVEPIWSPQVQHKNVPESPVITSQNKKTDNSFHNMDKILEVNKIRLDNLPRAYEVAKGRKAQLQGEIESPQCQLQLNSMPEIYELDQAEFSISTLPTPNRQSHYKCQDSYSIPSSIPFAQYLTESPQPQCQVMPGMHGLNDPTLQATNNPNTFQFQQKMPSMSTIPRDVVNFDPIWPPQVQLNNIPESRYEENTSSENYY